MASSVSIVNRALTKLGAERILDLSDQNKNARVMKALYDDNLEQELATHCWKFAIRREQLAALSESPAFGYTYAYQLPRDYLAIVQVGQWPFIQRAPENKPLWTMEAMQILTDLAPPLAIRYISNQINPRDYSPLFIEVLASKLALEACESITQSNTKKQMLQQEYQFAVNRAIQLSVIEKAPDMLHTGNWLQARTAG